VGSGTSVCIVSLLGLKIAVNGSSLNPNPMESQQEQDVALDVASQAKSFKAPEYKCQSWETLGCSFP
jgi:hypothetical protein